MNTFFHIGSQFKLSKLELEKLFPENSFTEIDFSLISSDLILEKDEIIDLQKKLGGTIKISILKKEISGFLEGEILEILQEKRKNFEGKMRVGINILGKIEEFSLNKFIKSAKIIKSTRFVNNSGRNIEGIITKKQILDKNGIELNILDFEGKVFITETISIQDFEEYKKRDYEKPFRDAKNGMIPVKLSQILLNISQEKKSFWDPFCGTGTFLIEGRNLGIEKIVGSDLAENMVEGTKENLQHFFGAGNGIDVFENDVKKFKEISVNAVISEGFLGKNLNDFATKRQIEENDDILADIWEKALDNFAKNGIKKVIFCLPLYSQAYGKNIYLEKTYEKISKSNYKIFPEKIFYARKGQFVFRDIIILDKK